MTSTLPTTSHGIVDENQFYANSSYFGALTDSVADYIPELTWPLSIRTYAKMRWDPQLKAVMSAYTLPIRRADWAVDGSGCDPVVTADVADNLGLPILGQKPKPSGARRRGVQWPAHLRLSLLDLTFGHMAFSRWYDVSGPKARIAGISERMPSTIEDINIDATGAIKFIDQGLNASFGTNNRILANELVWYANDREGSLWTGQSLMRSAYSAWLIKHELWRVHATSIRRFGMGIPQVNAPVGALPNQITEAQRLASGMRAGNSAGVGLPAGFSMELKGMTGSVPDAVEFIGYLDKQMTRATLTSLLDMSDSTHGSRALGETFMDLFLLALQAIGDEHAASATAQLAVPLVDANYGEDEGVPQIVCGDVGSEHEVTAQTLQLLLSSGALEPDESLDAYIRNQYKLPARTTPWIQPNTVPDPTKVHPTDGNGLGADSVPADDPGIAAAAGPSGHVYDWKHGWIPLSHAAAMAKAKGNHKLAEKYVPAEKQRKTPQHIIDYHAARQQQNARFESLHGAGISAEDTHRQEYKDYFGVGDHSTSGKVEDRVTFKSHLTNMAASKSDEQAHEHSYNAGVELGKRHQAAGLSTSQENAEYDQAEGKAMHADDFGQGYGDGLTHAYDEQQDKARRAQLVSR